MHDTSDLQREAHLLGEQVRSQRADAARTRRTDLGSLREMEARLSAVWMAIRAARAAGAAVEPNLLGGRSRPKWD